MAIRVFQAADLHQALSHMRIEMGPDAFVVYQRQVPASRWWPFGRKQWEVVASDQPDRPAVLQTTDEQKQQLEAEVAELKNGLASLVRSANLAKLPRCGKALTDCYDQLCQQGMQPELAQSLILAARDELSSAAQGQPEVVRAAVRRQLEQNVRIRAPRVLKGTGPLVIFLVGQTGVGKTTTLAKLAARQALQDGKRAAIVNMDLVRPGAQQQLETLSSVLKIAIEAARSPEELKAVLSRLADRDVIFVDTAGASRCDPAQVDALVDLVKVAPRRQTFLVLSAAMSLGEMNQTLRTFRSTGLDGIILSKVDETDMLGAALSLACQSTTPIAYVTNGRRIPEDIQPASAENLSGLLFPGAPALLLPRPKPKRTSQTKTATSKAAKTSAAARTGRSAPDKPDKETHET